MYIDIVPNRGSNPTILLRESYRDEWGKVRKRTLANLTRLPPQHIDLIRRLCRGEKLVPAQEALQVERSLPHGHVKAILGTMHKIGFDTLLSSRPCRERNLVMAMVAERLIHSCSKLACTRHWHTTTLAQELGVEDATVDELYKAMDWLLARQKRIENKLVGGGAIQLSLFGLSVLGTGVQNLAEITSPDFPGERLIACYNPLMADERRRKRDELLRATDEALERIRKEVLRRTRKPMPKEQIGLKVGRVLNRYKVGKHYKLKIEEGRFEWERDVESIRAEEALDGIYVLRTSEPSERFGSEEVVRGYKSLKHVERAFRCMKSLEIRVRPIHHRLEPRVRAHVFLCMLAYYIEWHMRRTLKGLLYDDECLDQREADPVLRMEPSASAKRKKGARGCAEGFRVQSFETLISELGTLCRNRCRVRAEGVAQSFEQETTPTELQARVFELLGL